ncbi:MAG: hypothetical protein M1824_004014 [Vezdaea acicularis]|nr:MAG: hypothetical protein M1824_004014 [Vezdaea acicularis]
MLQLQWNLDRTVDRGINLALNFVKIAHHDNIQPIALMACERFGATLPICHQTRRLVEKECCLQIDNVIINSIKALVIQAGGNTLESLATNLAGLNFLALATSLVSVTTITESSDAIQKMLENSASERHLVPPEFHIRRILEVLEPRLNRIGFLDRCYATDCWLKDVVDDYKGNKYTIPSATGVGSIVATLRPLFRLGDEQVDYVTITPNSCLAWLITFIEWCLGTRPSIYSSDGSPINLEPESKVRIVLPLVPKPSQGIGIETFTISNTLYDAICIHHAVDDYGEPLSWTGLVSIHTHAEQMLRLMDAEKGLGLRAVMNGLSYAITEVLDRITSAENFMSSHPPKVYPSMARLFPDTESIQRTIDTYFGRYAKDFPGLQKLSPGSRLSDVKIIRQWAEPSYNTGFAALKSKLDLYNTGKRSSDSTLESTIQVPDYTLDLHIETHVTRNIAKLMSNILVLSLVHSDLEIVRLCLKPKFGPTDLDIVQKIFEALSSSDPVTCKVTEVFTFFLALLDHDEAKFSERNTISIEDNWLATSARGQVLFPRLLLDMSLEKTPIIQFICLPGVLSMKDRPKGEQFRSLISDDRGYESKDPAVIPSSQIGNLSRFSTLRHEWRFRIVPDSVPVHLSLKDYAGYSTRVGPGDILRGCPNVLFVLSCNHVQDMVIEEQVEDYVFVHPDDFLRGLVYRGKILIYAVRGNDPLRLMIIGVIHGSSRNLVAFSRDACLKCSLQLCRIEDVKCLIC